LRSKSSDRLSKHETCKSFFEGRQKQDKKDGFSFFDSVGPLIKKLTFSLFGFLGNEQGKRKDEFSSPLLSLFEGRQDKDQDSRFIRRKRTESRNER